MTFPSGTRAMVSDVGGTSTLPPSAGDCWEQENQLGIEGKWRQDVAAMFLNDELYVINGGNTDTNGSLTKYTTHGAEPIELTSGFSAHGNNPGSANDPAIVADPDVGGRPRPIQRQLVNDGQYIYIGGDGGVWRYDTLGAVGNLTHIFADDLVRGFSEDAHRAMVNDFLYFGGIEGVYRIDNPSTAPAVSAANPAGAAVNIAPGIRGESLYRLPAPNTNALMVAAHKGGVYRIQLAHTATPTITWVGPDPSFPFTDAAGWTEKAVSIAVSPVSLQVITTIVNPKDGAHWAYFNPNALTASPTNWTGATNQVNNIVNPGNDFAPPNRELGSTPPVPPTGQKSDFFGAWTVESDPDNDGIFWLGSMLSAWKADFSGLTDGLDAAWETDNQCNSNGSVMDSACTEDGRWRFWAWVDHKLVGEEIGVPDSAFVVPTPTGIGLGNDGFGVATCGTGAQTLVICTLTGGGGAGAANDSANNLLFYFGDIGADGGPEFMQMQVSDYQTDLVANGASTGINQTPRPGIPVIVDMGGGIKRIITYADGVGYVRADFNMNTGQFVTAFTPQASPSSASFPTTINSFDPRDLAAADDGSVLWGYDVGTNQIWRSFDQGETWTPLPTGPIFEAERQGHVDLCTGPDGITVGAWSAGNGTYVVSPADDPNAVPVQVGPETGALAFTPNCRLIATSQADGGELVCYEGISTGQITNLDVAPQSHKAYGDDELIQNINIECGEIQLSMQGGGAVVLPFSEAP